MAYRDLPSDDLALLCADAGNAEAWSEFVRRCQRPIACVAMRVCRQWGEHSTSVVDDLVQETFLRLCAARCRLLRAFKPRHPDSILGYVRLIAASVALDYFRAQCSDKRGGKFRNVAIEDHLNALGSNSAEREIELGLQLASVQRAMSSISASQLPERDRMIFWLYFKQGFTCQAISQIAMLNLNVKGVESSIHRTTLLLRELLAPPMMPVEGVRPKGRASALPIIREEL